MPRIFVLLVITLVSGCIASVNMQSEVAESDDWLQTVMEYRARANDAPRNADAQMALEKVERKAARHYLEAGKALVKEGKLDEAIVKFRNGLVARPDDELLKGAISEAMARKEARYKYEQALSFIELNRFEEAKQRLKAALDLYPFHSRAQAKLDEVIEKQKKREIEQSTLSSRERITLNFSETGIRDAFQYIADAYNLNVLFDNEVKSAPVTLYAENVRLREALDLLLQASDMQYKQIGANTLLVAPNTKEKRAEYEDRILRTFSLNTVKAAKMGEILKANLKLDSVVVNEHMNTLTVRDTEEVLTLAEKLVIANDQPAGEVILDVEVLEVDRTKTEQLGLDLGEQVTLSYPQYTVSDSFEEQVLKKGVVTIPTITFNYLKKDVDATILASPSLRALDNEQAKLHIGERVPLRSSTILDATGQTRTTFEYRDVGIKLDVLPDIHIDGSVSANVRVEVSALGANVGTPGEPAISILTRQVETNMLLKDGETAVIGGLIQNMNGSNKVRPVGLGEIPGIGRLFTSSSDEKRRTDVMLTITPRIVRPQAIPPREVREFFSGNAQRFSSEALFPYIGSDAILRIGPERSASQTAAPAVSQASVTNDGGSAADKPALRFSDGKYEVEKGERITVTMTADALGSIQKLPLQVLFNPSIMEFSSVEAVAGGNLSVVANEGENPGSVSIELTGTPAQASGELLDITFETRAAGISYLMSRPVVLTTGDGESVPLDSFMSRILVK